MKLVVKNNNGDKFTLQIRPNETFLDLKRRVELESGISLDLRDITSNKRNINEQQKVIDYFLSEQNQVVQNAPAPEVVCAVPTCENKKSTHPDKTYFEFPDEDIRCHQWVLYCRRIASRLSADARSNLPVNVGAPGTAVCSDHFKADQFVKNTTTLLKRTAVPCINPELPSAAPTFNVNRRSVKAPDPKILSQNILQDSLSSSSNAMSKNASSPTPYVSHKPFGTSSTKLTCRLCALPARNTVFIYSREGKNMMLAEKICASLPIKVKMTDNLPKQVCRPCIERLNATFYLVEICTAADDNFKKSDENKRKELRDKEAIGVCPCCVDGQLSLLSDSVEGNLDAGTVLEELFSDQGQEQEVREVQNATDGEQDAQMETGEIVQPVESTGSEQGEYGLSDILDLEGSINGEEVKHTITLVS
uniref:52 kDa repressor of the inhibitor of the protein kinase n=1 Tax=Lygus hesperus TaxID=30085 RepID=A0A0A9XXN4_LYGHE